MHCFSPDGRRIVTGCLDSTGAGLGHGDRHETVPAMKHTHWHGAYIQPRRPPGAVLEQRRDTARVWDAATGAPRCDPMRHPAAVLAAPSSAPTAPAWHAVRRPRRPGLGRRDRPAAAAATLAPRPGDRDPVQPRRPSRAHRERRPDGPPLGPGQREPRGPAARRQLNDGSRPGSAPTAVSSSRTAGGAGARLGCRDRLASGPPLAQPRELARRRGVQPGRPLVRGARRQSETRADAWVWDLETRR